MLNFKMITIIAPPVETIINAKNYEALSNLVVGAKIVTTNDNTMLHVNDKLIITNEP